MMLLGTNMGKITKSRKVNFFAVHQTLCFIELCSLSKFLHRAAKIIKEQDEDSILPKGNCHPRLAGNEKPSQVLMDENFPEKGWYVSHPILEMHWSQQKWIGGKKSETPKKEIALRWRPLNPRLMRPQSSSMQTARPLPGLVHQRTCWSVVGLFSTAGVAATSVNLCFRKPEQKLPKSHSLGTKGDKRLNTC